MIRDANAMARAAVRFGFSTSLTVYRLSKYVPTDG
jgi:hypothetical protein